MAVERKKPPALPPAKQATRMKVISIGNEGVGKSCLIKRYCEEKFVSKYISTIGVDFGVKPVKLSGVSIRVNFFDFAGGVEYFDIRSEFYKDAQGCLLVYDVGVRETFDALEGWVEEANAHGAQDPVIFIVGNKSDSKKRVVPEAEGKKWASTRGFGFFETSAKDGDNVAQMFEAVFAAVTNKK